MEKFEPNFNMIISGITSSGKTNCLRNIMFLLKDKFDYGLIFSPTCKVNNDYDFIDPAFRFEKFNENKIKKLIKIQKELKQKDITKRAFIILDDFINMETNTNDTLNTQYSVLSELYSRGRHFNISTIMICQHLKSCSPIIRSNSQIILITKINDSNYSTLAEMVTGFTKKTLKEYLEKNCKNYNVICFDLRNQYENECVRIIKPSDRIKFKMNFNNRLEKK